MLLRIFRGRVLPGREDEFVARCRQQVADQAATTSGLLSFMAGYRRVDRSDRFVLVSTWAPDQDVVETVSAEPIGRSRSADMLAGVAEMERVERFDLIPPVHRGILDAPGAIIRVTEATILPGKREDLLAWVRRIDRTTPTMRLVLALAIGTRTTDGVERVAGVSAWASPLVMESLADPGRRGMTMFAEVDAYITDVSIEQYQALELRLPERLHELGGLRLIAARFTDPTDAEAARTTIGARLSSVGDAGVSVASLAHANPGEGEAQLLVARVVLAEHLAAERLIADLGGEILHEADEPKV